MLGVGLLVVTISLELWTSFIAPVVTTTSIILSSNKIRNGEVLVPDYPGCPGKWPLNEHSCWWSVATTHLYYTRWKTRTWILLCSSVEKIPQIRPYTREILLAVNFPSLSVITGVLRHCCLGDRKGVQSAKIPASAMSKASPLSSSSKCRPHSRGADSTAARIAAAVRGLSAGA